MLIPLVPDCRKFEVSNCIMNGLLWFKDDGLREV